MEIYTVNTLAEKMGKSPITVRGYCYDGSLKKAGINVRQIGNNWIIVASDVQLAMFKARPERRGRPRKPRKDVVKDGTRRGRR